MILYIQNPLKNLLGLTNDITKAAGYKINIPKSVAFLYINNEQCKNKVKKTISFIKMNSIKKNKVLRDRFNQVGARIIH